MVCPELVHYGGIELKPILELHLPKKHRSFLLLFEMRDDNRELGEGQELCGTFLGEGIINSGEFCWSIMHGQVLHILWRKT